MQMHHESQTAAYDIRLYTLLATVPEGCVVTYGQLAQLIGLPRRARWVGQILKQLPDDTRLPWHRVVNAQGQISLPLPGPGERQKTRLESEGVEITAGGKIRLSRYLWQPDNGYRRPPSCPF